MYRVVLLLLATTAVARGEPAYGPNLTSPGSPDSTRAPAIVGGTLVPAGTWPDAVAVIGSMGTCTGTLIAPDVVLTAGHCTEIDPVQIIANTTDYAAQGGVNVDVVGTAAYPGWISSYDVAVLHLAKPVAGVTPRPVGMGCTFAAFHAGSHVDLVGFGLTDSAAADDNTQLHEAMAAVTDPTCGGGGEGCQASVSPGGEFVAGGNGVDTCNGDSGGPAYFETPGGAVVIGVVSRGVDGSQSACGGGGIYVRTDKITAWLEQNAGPDLYVDDCGERSGSGTGDGSSDASGYGEVAGGCEAAPGSGGAGGLAIFALWVVRRRPARGRARPSPGQRAR